LTGIGPLNEAILDTDIFSEITRGVDQIVAAHSRAYRRAFARYTISAVTLMEVIRGYQKKQATRQLLSFLAAIVSKEVIPQKYQALAPFLHEKARRCWAACEALPGAPGCLPPVPMLWGRRGTGGRQLVAP
jgi:hypothetical protein